MWGWRAQTTEAEKLKKKSKEFEDRVAEYFAYFKKQMPFNYSGALDFELWTPTWP